MDIKQLLKTAIDAKIGGDTKGFTEAMKQVMSAKVSSMIAEQGEFGEPADEGEYNVVLEEYDYEGTLVDAHLGINIGHYQAPTRGNFSSQAQDPSEYYGDPEELEWYVVSASLIMEDGQELRLVGEQAAALTFNEREQERIDEDLKRQMGAQRDDEMTDRFD